MVSWVMRCRLDVEVRDKISWQKFCPSTTHAERVPSRFMTRDACICPWPCYHQGPTSPPLSTSKAVLVSALDIKIVQSFSGSPVGDIVTMCRQIVDLSLVAAGNR
jgi:hypothetical protein